MRNAIGAGWIFGICLTFIVLFTAYLAITLNYAKAFRVKNHIISKIEEHGGYEENLEEGIAEFMFNQGLSAYGNCEAVVDSTNYNESWIFLKSININAPAGKNNVCIYRSAAPSKVEDGPKKQYKYRVVTFFRFDIPVVRYFTAFQVAGESRYIYDYTVE